MALCISLLADASELAGLRRRLRVWLDDTGVSAEAADSLVLATHEAAAHAVSRPGRPNFLTIGAALEDEAVSVTVVDPRPGGLYDRDGELAERLAFMRALIEYVEIESGPRASTIHLRQSI